MKIEQVKKLTPLDRFLYWIRERHQIHLRRKTGMVKPWTDDEVLRTVFFTNPYRENDKVTVWFRENIREPLRDNPNVLFATIAFRWFNLPESAYDLVTGWRTPPNDPTIGKQYWEEPLVADNLLVNWGRKRALGRLGSARDRGEKIFTGAYMINSPAGKPKLEAICDRIQQVWDNRDTLLQGWHRSIEEDEGGLTLQAAHKTLQQFDGMGGFMAYEVVCDLRYTYLLEDATDKLTWANPGPGAIRGMCRILGIDFPKGKNSHGFTPSVKFDFQEEARKLLKIMQQRLPNMPPFEMREVEHSCCEFDKFERVLWGDGRPKRNYNGVR